MFDGYQELLPIQGGIVAAILLGVALVKLGRGAQGSDRFTWNTIGIVSFLYLFVAAAWFVFWRP